MKIKSWKLDEITRDMNGGFLEEINGIVRETEKAYCLSITWGYTSSLTRTANVWVPKSATMTDEESAAEQIARASRFEEGCKKCDALIALAKANGIKGVRAGMKAATIKSKLAAAGVAY